MPDVAIQQASPDELPDVSGAVRTVFNVLDAWGASAKQAQALLGLPARTYYDWLKRAPRKPDQDKVERISYILGIWKDLQILFPDREFARRWPTCPNDAPLFHGQAPIQVMASGRVADLYRVRALLDGWRG
ncbi:MAG TPA: MbcA/ParS/Xre antitoxin family protein [Gammaproteobacteria bacterium]|nr:MbcA/ParS/Xre antitoxin family protein [Gammaproteobacteria bacterium]